jgi:hypothetical protein
MTAQVVMGVAAGVLSLMPCPVYVWSIVKGRTRPDRVTWWVLSLVSGMIVATYGASGARETIWLPIGYTVSFAIVALFSLRYGDGPPHLHVLDRVCLASALLSAVVWWSFNAPLPALVMTIITEFMGLIPTAMKAYKRPVTESQTAWIITTIASLSNLLAVHEWSFAIAAYPIYVFLTNAVMVVFIIRPRAEV